MRMADLWPFLWIPASPVGFKAQHCAFLPGLPLLLPLHCCQCSTARNVFGAYQARTGSGCVGKISVIMSIQPCLGFFNSIEKSQRHYASTLGGAGPCYIFHGLIQSSSAVPWHSVMVPARGPPGTKLLPAPRLCAPCCPCSPS